MWWRAFIRGTAFGPLVRLISKRSHYVFAKKHDLSRPSIPGWKHLRILSRERWRLFQSPWFCPMRSCWLWNLPKLYKSESVGRGETLYRFLVFLCWQGSDPHWTPLRNFADIEKYGGGLWKISQNDRNKFRSAALGKKITKAWHMNISIIFDMKLTKWVLRLIHWVDLSTCMSSGVDGCEKGEEISRLSDWIESLRMN